MGYLQQSNSQKQRVGRWLPMTRGKENGDLLFNRDIVSGIQDEQGLVICCTRLWLWLTIQCCALKTVRGQISCEVFLPQRNKNKKKLSRKSNPTISASLSLSLPHLQGVLKNTIDLRVWAHQCSHNKRVLLLRKTRTGNQRWLPLISFYALDLSEGCMLHSSTIIPFLAEYFCHIS